MAGECAPRCQKLSDCATGTRCEAGVCIADSPDGASANSPETDSGVPNNDIESESTVDAAVPPTALVPNTDEAEACVDIEVQLEEVTPSVLLVVDKSGSMLYDFGETTRWQAVRDALVAPETGLVTQLEERVRFGALLYSSNVGFEGGTCPILDGTETPIALGNREAIANLYDSVTVETLADTPTAESLVQARQQLAELDEPGPKLMILATDGDPDTCAEPDSNGLDAPKRASESELQLAHEAGIETRVLAVGEDTIEQTHLQNLANAGAGFATDGEPHATAHEASNPEELVEVLRSIIAGVRSCQLALDYEVTDEEAAKGEVMLDGTPLQLGTDWQLSTPSTLELRGDACEQLKQDASDLSVTFPCTAEIVQII